MVSLRSGLQLIVDVHGVGYDVLASGRLADRAIEGSELSFPVYTHVQEDALRLFGFVDLAEKQVFTLLTRVSGLGPKSALEIVSQMECRDLLRCIGTGDVTALTRLRGVGRKKAERIIVELKDIVMALPAEHTASLRGQIEILRSASAPVSSVEQDAVGALEVLGFSRRDAERAVTAAWSSGEEQVRLDPGALVGEALKHV
jgi:Holliday junction DNA helicase RuvA